MQQYSDYGAGLQDPGHLFVQKRKQHYALMSRVMTTTTVVYGFSHIMFIFFPLLEGNLLQWHLGVKAWLANTYHGDNTPQ